MEIETGPQWYLTNNHGGKGHVIDLMGIDQAMGMGYTMINEDSWGFQGISPTFFRDVPDMIFMGIVWGYRQEYGAYSSAHYPPVKHGI